MKWRELNKWCSFLFWLSKKMWRNWKVVGKTFLLIDKLCSDNYQFSHAFIFYSWHEHSCAPQSLGSRPAPPGWIELLARLVIWASNWMSGFISQLEEDRFGFTVMWQNVQQYVLIWIDILWSAEMKNWKTNSKFYVNYHF